VRLETIIYSKSVIYKEGNFTSKHHKVDYENVINFVAYDYDCKWGVPCVMNTEEEITQ
jgi:hypothetical protein